MARTLIATTDYRVAQGNPTIVDIKNRQIKELWASFIIGHSATTGKHLTPFTNLGIFEVGTYAGTGAAQTITLVGNCASRDLKIVLIWSEATGAVYIRTDTMTVTKKTTVAIDGYSGAITALGSGFFTLGTDTTVNDNGVTYYFIVIASGQTPNTGSAASPPAWIGNNVALLGGNSATMANSVETALDTSFQVEHTEAGAHKTAAWQYLSLVETGTFTPDLTASQTVTLDNSSIDIAFLLILSEDTQGPFFKTADMTVLRQFSNAALAVTPPILTLGTGGFTVDSTQYLPQETIMDIQDQADGTTLFPDSSSYGFDLSYTGTVSWTNTTFGEGTTSIFINTGLLSIYNTALTLPDDWEVEFWVKFTTTDNFYSFFYMGTAFSSTGGHIELGHAEGFDDGASGLVVISGRLGNPSPGTDYKPITGTTDVKDGLWHLINLIYSNGILTLKVDSTIEGTPIALSIALTTQFRIGNIPGASIGTCYVDRIKIKRTPRLLSAQEHHYLAIGTI